MKHGDKVRVVFLKNGVVLGKRRNVNEQAELILTAQVWQLHVERRLHVAGVVETPVVAPAEAAPVEAAPEVFAVTVNVEPEVEVAAEVTTEVTAEVDEAPAEVDDAVVDDAPAEEATPYRRRKKKR